MVGSGYSVSGITLPKTLNAGATVLLSVKFAPAKLGSVTGKLQMISNAANGTLVVPLYGAGVASQATTSQSTSSLAATTAKGYVSPTPVRVHFGSVAAGTKNTQVIQLKNTGAASLTISSVIVKGTGFSISGLTTPVTLAAGATKQLTVAFQPATAGSYSGAVGVGSNASDSFLTVVASGTGTGSSRVLSITPTSVAFGSVGVGSSTTREITLKNSGNSNITISGDSVTGTGLSATGLGGSVTLTPGQSAVLVAGFAPKAAGNVTGSITITSNATNGTSIAAPITGTGVVSTKVIDLQWQPSTSSGVIGYYVYRSSVSGGPYTKLVGSAIAGTGYADNNVAVGSYYYYVVTAVSSGGTESVYSNQAGIKVP